MRWLGVAILDLVAQFIGDDRNYWGSREVLPFWLALGFATRAWLAINRQCWLLEDSDRDLRHLATLGWEREFDSDYVTDSD